ncbi:MAG: hypothetical protein JXO22_12965 [Phycisphaerae bacterium]|nr:hypothetical protein [Phycisphaerae bacterium]
MVQRVNKAESLNGCRRNLAQRADMVALLIRHRAVVIVAAVVLVGPGAATAGEVALAVVGWWSAYRLVTHASSPKLIAADLCVHPACSALFHG